MADKTEYALHHGLKAIVCIGETLQERESGELWNVLDSQLKVTIHNTLSDIAGTGKDILRRIRCGFVCSHNKAIACG